MDAAYYVAGIDAHKRMLAVVVANARDRDLQFECRRFGTTVSELQNLSTWLRGRAVQEVLRESTAQYWKWKASSSSGWHKHGRTGRTEVLGGARPTFETRSAA